MNSTFTAVYRQFPEGYAAFVEEFPGANTQGATLDKARANLLEAARMVLEANRQLAEEEMRGQEVIREPLALGFCAESNSERRRRNSAGQRGASDADNQ
jgi:predicted RNase H-like HicB family nuclease